MTHNMTRGNRTTGTMTTMTTDTELTPEERKALDSQVLSALRHAETALQAVPAYLLRHGADSAVTDLLHRASHHLALACRRIQFDTYRDKKNKGKK